MSWTASHTNAEYSHHFWNRIELRVSQASGASQVILNNRRIGQCTTYHQRFAKGGLWVANGYHIFQFREFNIQLLHPGRKKNNCVLPAIVLEEINGHFVQFIRILQISSCVNKTYQYLTGQENVKEFFFVGFGGTTEVSQHNKFLLMKKSLTKIPTIY